MPIKLKCKCGQVLNVPDKMAGKTGKCPKCKNPLKIPAAATQAKKPAAAPATAAPEIAPKMDALFDEAGLKEQTGPTCPKCMQGISPGTVVCTNCGHNMETGESLVAFNAQVEGPEFDNMYLQEAANNMVRDKAMDSRRSKASMPWWVLMSFLIGAITLCCAGVVIVDGKFGTPSDPSTFIGKVQAWPVFTTLGLTALITGLAISIFAHLDICIFAFTRKIGQGFACFFLPVLYSLVYGIMNWTDNKAPIKAIMMAAVFIGLGVFLIIQGGGFNLVFDAFK